MKAVPCSVCGKERMVKWPDKRQTKCKPCAMRIKSTIHGGSYSRAYKVWSSMKGRCENSMHASFKDYGARGIKVCERWQSFTAFYEDMGDPPAGMSIDRRNNDGDYEPDNCRWASSVEQNNNRRANKPITINGETKNLYAWLAEFGMDYSTYAYRVRHGMSEQEALTTPRNRKQNHQNFTINGKSQSFDEWLRENKVSRTTFYRRVEQGWSEEDAMSVPPKEYKKNGVDVRLW